MAAPARTLRRRIEHEIAKRKGSRFIAAAWPLDGGSGADAERIVQAQVKEMLEERCARFPSACHHCYAYTTMDGREYCSDDGEPHGTAGRPILTALQRAQLVDVCLVVSRIFGGTKLGTGGLIRAYGSAAQEAIEHEGEIIAKVPMTTLRISAPFAHVDTVKHGCAKFLADIAAQDFASAASFVVRVPSDHAHALADYLRSRSSGGVHVASAVGHAQERES